MSGSEASAGVAGRAGLAEGWIPPALLAATTGALAVGGGLWFAGLSGTADLAWAAGAAAGLLAAAWWVLEAALRRRLGADVLAVMALAGTLAVGEYLAGAVVALMLASGRVLEAWASARSQRELRALLDRAPRIAHLSDGELTDVAVDLVRVGALVLVKPGEVVPVDGMVVGGAAVVDESALTGEPVPVELPEGGRARSGTVNAGGPFRLRATTTAENSSYAGIVRLVSAAEQTRAPAVRLADRYAAVFLAASLAVAGGTWAASGSATRAVAVLVVATPCPLILAVPVALVSGLARCAARGVVVKGGGVLEVLARTKVLLFDKTGTLTAGTPAVAAVVAAGTLPEAEILRLAASLDQLSPHILASAVVRAARSEGVGLAQPTGVEEVAGSGVRGLVDGRAVAIGKASWVAPGPEPAWVRTARKRAERDGSLTVFLAVEGRLEGAILLRDPVRPDASRAVRRLRRNGIDRVVMVTGDRTEVAEGIGAIIGVDEVLAERTPAEKVEAVVFERRSGTTVMVGDGINDAPALAAADVGVAIGARGSTASSEAADVVLTADRLDRVGEAVAISRRTLAIATESVVAGIGLSLAAMGVAAAGLLPPAWGALTQEAIDGAVILNSLRILRVETEPPGLEAADAELALRFRAEHDYLRAALDQVAAAADAIGAGSVEDSLRRAREVHRVLVEEIEPHEVAEDAKLYPVLNRVLGGVDATGPMSRSHLEIAHMIRRLGRILDDVDATSVTDEDVVELRRLLYGLHAILALHFAQEDEGYLSLIEEPSH